MLMSMISDGNIRYYEFEGDQLHFLNEYKTSDPRMCISFHITSLKIITNMLQ